MWARYGSRIFIVERDFYARQAIASYLSWDRRTRVIGMAATPLEMLAELDTQPEEGHLNAVILDTGLALDAAGLVSLICWFRQHIPEAKIVCLAHSADRELALAARQAGACAYLTREAVGIGIASAVYYALHHTFVVTRDVLHRLVSIGEELAPMDVLPSRRQYDRLTPRIEQALWLCVVEGLPAELAAEEMGVSTSTIRSYIKEGYRILEAEDETSYPPTISPAERAFLRFTALEKPELPTPYRAA